MIRFQCDCGATVEVPSDLAGKRARCGSCQTVVRVPEEEIYVAEVVEETTRSADFYDESPAVDYHESAALKALYWLSLAVGLGLAIFIYLIKFDDFSETFLVQITPAWFFPLVFGTYGLVSESLIRKIRAGKANTLAEAAKLMVNALSVIGLILVLPFLVLRWRNSLLVSFVASAFWAVLLLIFFGVFWRML